MWQVSEGALWKDGGRHGRIVFLDISESPHHNWKRDWNENYEHLDNISLKIRWLGILTNPKREVERNESPKATRPAGYWHICRGKGQDLRTEEPQNSQQLFSVSEHSPTSREVAGGGVKRGQKRWGRGKLQNKAVEKRTGDLRDKPSTYPAFPMSTGRKHLLIQLF